MSRRARPVILAVLSVMLTSALSAWSPAVLPDQAQSAAEARQAQRPLRLGLSTGARPMEEDDLLDQVLAAGKLVVATDPNYPPFSSINEHGEFDGFDVEVAKDVARRLGVELEFATPSWNAVISGNWGGLWDLSIGSMTPTDSRALVLWFTDPYYYMPGSFAVHDDNTTITTVAELSGKRLGILPGSPCEAWLNGELPFESYGGVIAYPPPPGIQAVFYDTDIDAIQDLALGDGVVLDAVMTAWFTIQQASDAGMPLGSLGDPAFYEPLVFALDQARGPSDKMLAALNGIIADMKGDGKLAWCSGRWFGFDISQPVPPGPAQFTSVYLPRIAR